MVRMKKIDVSTRGCLRESIKMSKKFKKKIEEGESIYRLLMCKKECFCV